MAAAIPVPAVVVAADGRHFGGSNVENAAYGTTLCAEANAIGTAISAGARRLEVIAVSSPDGTDVFPCGNCRQLMNEFGVETVIVVADDGRPREYAMGELMPYAFGPEDLPGANEG